MLLTSQSGFESMLAQELVSTGASVTAQGPGWVLADGVTGDLAFAHLSLADPIEIKG